MEKSDMSKIVLFAVLLGVSFCSIQWKSYEEGIREIEDTQKPGIVFIHYSTCPACININKIINASNKIDELSKQFVMISCVNGKEPKDIAYKGDGGYVPRIFFVSPYGRVLSQIKATDSDSKFKYYYYSEQRLIHNMRKVLALYHNHP